MKLTGALLVAGFLMAGCAGGGAPSARVISTLNTVGTGQQRILVEISGPDREPLAIESMPQATLRDENGSPLGVYPGELVWIVPETDPAYAFVVDIPNADTYQLTIDVGELGETGPAGFGAVENPIQVEIGDPAPEVSGEAVDGPALVVFASPDSCPSQSCRPLMTQVERLAALNDEVDWRHVEVFIDPEADSGDDPSLSGDVQVWGLPSQPWLYAVDRTGKVAAAFEGAASDREIEQAIDLITDPA